MADEQQQPAVDDAGQRPNEPVNEAAPQETGIQDPLAYYRAQAEKNERLVKKMQDQLAAIDKAKQDEEEAKALQQGKHKEIIDSLKPKAERLEKLESVFQNMYDRRLEQIPEDHKGRISTLLDRIPAIEDKLDALDMQLELINSLQPVKATAPNLNASEGVTPKQKPNDDLTEGSRQLRQLARERGFLRRKS